MKRWSVLPITITLAMIAASWTVLSDAAGHPAAKGGGNANAMVELRKLLAQVPMGEEVQPERCILDPYPEFNGIAVDPVNDLVVMSAPNIRSVMLYRRTAGSIKDEMTQPLGERPGA